MNNRTWQIDCGELRIIFNREKGPMPHTVSVKRFDGSYLPVIVNEKTDFSVADGNGNIYHPALTAEPSFFEDNGAKCVLFNNLCFVNQNGVADKYFTGTFMYEIFPDGTVFTNCFFLSNRADKCTLKDLKVAFNTDVSGFDDTRYGILHRPAKIDGATIQDLSPKRFVARNTPQNLPEITPLATFNNFKDHGENLYEQPGLFMHMEFMPTLQSVEIPMYLYLHPAHPDKSLVESVRHRPFASEDLPYLLLHLGKLNYAGADMKKSPFSPEFKPKKRLVSNCRVDYEKLKKDGHGNLRNKD